MNKVTSDGLITERDIEMFKIGISRGHLKDQVYDIMNTEPQLALYLGERYGKALRSLQDAGITGRRLAALHKHISLLMWSSAILTSKAHRREWESFLPSDEITDPNPERKQP